jgi:hypothetical protein
MAQYNIKMTEISATMLDELADFVSTAWGVTDLIEVEVVPGWSAQPAPSAIEFALPDPMPASAASTAAPATSSIEIILPPEPLDLPPDADEASTPARKRR